MPRHTHTLKGTARSTPLPDPTGENEMSKDLTKYITTEQAAQILGVLPTSINHLIYGGKVKAQKRGRDWLVFQPSVEKYLANKSKRGRPSSGSPTIQVEQKPNGQG